MSKVIEIDKVNQKLIFDDGSILYSDHDGQCCEWHEITLGDLELSDFEGLEFDLTKESVFNKISGYGIELIPIRGHSVKIPAHGYNNGYYGDNLDLIIETPQSKIIYDITECQVIQD